MVMNFDRTISSFIEGLCSSGVRDKGVVVTVEVEGHIYCPIQITEALDKKKDKHIKHKTKGGKIVSVHVNGYDVASRVMLQFFFYRPMNYTLVLVQKGKSWFGSFEPEDVWLQTSYHDSCWSSDGLRPLKETQSLIMDLVGEDYKKLLKKYKLDETEFYRAVNMEMSVTRVEQININAEDSRIGETWEHQIVQDELKEENRKENGGIDYIYTLVSSPAKVKKYKLW